MRSGKRHAKLSNSLFPTAAVAAPPEQNLAQAGLEQAQAVRDLSF